MKPDNAPNPDPTPIRLMTVTEFFERMRDMANSLVTLAHDYVVTLDHRPEFKQECLDKGADREALRRLELVGRKCMIPELILRTDPGAHRIISLPLSDQTRALTHGIEVLDEDETSTRMIPLDQLNPDQARQTIDNGKIRTLAEQRTWIRKRKARRPKAVAEGAVRIHRDHVEYQGIEITKRQMLQWLQEMG